MAAPLRAFLEPALVGGTTTVSLPLGVGHSVGQGSSSTSVEAGGFCAVVVLLPVPVDEGAAD